MRRGEHDEDRKPKRIVHPGFSLIQPLGQGDYDGLCGLYAILNAIRLAAAPTQILSHKYAQRLFVSGVRYLSDRDALERAVCWAIKRQHLQGLVRHLRREAWAIAKLRVHHEHLLEDGDEIDAEQVFAALDHYLSQRKVVLAFLRGAYRHYTVVAGSTRSSLILFDSYGYRWLRKASCVVTATDPARHNVHAASLMAISVV